MGAALVILLVGLGALATGVLIGRYYVPDDRMLRRSARHGRAYMRALVHHIARDHDTVIAELRKVVEENVEDSEPYFALAALFRARGEHERSIRVHQALAVREGATHRLRQRALYELGLDFRAAGMPRRAARAFEDVLTSEPRHEGALRALCGVYEEQGRFAEAAGAWTRLCRLRGEAPPRRAHHLLCAAAQRAIVSGDLDSARRLLKEARADDGDESAHFLAVAAELAAARDNPQGARERVRQALLAAPELARFLVPGLAAAERQLAAVASGRRAPASAVDDDVEDRGAGDAAGRDAAGAGVVAEPAGPGSTATALPAGPAPDAASAVASGSGSAPAASAVAAEPDERTARAAARAAAATLAELADTSASPHLQVVAAEALAPIDPAAALARFRKVAADSPEHLPARIAAARLALAAGEPAPIAAELTALAGAGGALAWADGGSWRCPHCGHRATAFAWRCAGCRRWGAARPEVGRERVIVAPPPRERRAEPRLAASDELGRTLLGDAATAALPPPALDHGLSDVELSARAERRSVLGRVGGWISGAWSGMRRKKA